MWHRVECLFKIQVYNIHVIRMSLGLYNVIDKKQQLLEGGPTSHETKLLCRDIPSKMTNYMVINQSL